MCSSSSSSEQISSILRASRVNVETKASLARVAALLLSYLYNLWLQALEDFIHALAPMLSIIPVKSPMMSTDPDDLSLFTGPYFQLFDAHL